MNILKKYYDINLFLIAIMDILYQEAEACFDWELANNYDITELKKREKDLRRRIKLLKEERKNILRTRPYSYLTNLFLKEINEDKKICINKSILQMIIDEIKGRNPEVNNDIETFFNASNVDVSFYEVEVGFTYDMVEKIWFISNTQKLLDLYDVEKDNDLYWMVDQEKMTEDSFSSRVVSLNFEEGGNSVLFDQKICAMELVFLKRNGNS